MLVTMRAKAAGAVVAGLGLLVACGGGHTSASPQASKIAAHLRLLAGTADFRQVPAGVASRGVVEVGDRVAALLGADYAVASAGVSMTSSMCRALSSAVGSGGNSAAMLASDR